MPGNFQLKTQNKLALHTAINFTALNFLKIYCANGKNAKGFEALAFPMQNSKFSVELSCLEIFN
jgi:hypothetical protein